MLSKKVKVKCPHCGFEQWATVTDLARLISERCGDEDEGTGCGEDFIIKSALSIQAVVTIHKLSEPIPSL